MQKTLISISKGKEGPTATLRYPNRIKTETSPIRTALWTSVLLGLWTENKITEKNNQSINLESLISISLGPDGLTITDNNQELSLSDYKLDDISHLMRTAMILLGKQDKIVISDLTQDLNKQREQKRMSYNKLPI
jgi:hypothetical protein